MSFTAAMVWSLLRSLAISLVGLSIAVRLTRSLRSLSGQEATYWWGLTLLPVFVPGLLIGYGYRNFALSLVHHPVWNDLLYALLVMLQVTPVGVLVLVCSPAPPVIATAVHVRRLAVFPPSPFEGRGASRATLPFIGDLFRHHAFALLPAGTVMFLLAFQESEVATLMQASGWTEWLFTRYVGGLTMPAALRVLVLPVMLQLSVMAIALWVVSTASTNQHEEVSASSASHQGQRWALHSFVSLALFALAGVPGSVVLRGTLSGFSVLSAHPTLVREVSVALLFAVTAGALAWMLSGWVVVLSGGTGRLFGITLLMPGLMGALALGMSVAGLVQRPPLVSLRDTPLPLLIAEILFLLPRAMLIRLLVGRLADSSAVHTARLLTCGGDERSDRAAELMWRLDAVGRWGGLLLICFWAYIELTLPLLLAPPGMTPAPVVLYNLMHYGQISGLSAMLLASLATPVVVMIVMWGIFRGIITRLHSF